MKGGGGRGIRRAGSGHVESLQDQSVIAEPAAAVYRELLHADRSRVAHAIPHEAVGLKLFKIVREELVACEGVRFVGGAAAVETTLRRAAISGRVDVGGDIKDHFADILDADGSMIQTVALDARSYGALKNKWMRCRLEPPPLPSSLPGRAQA